MTPDSVPALTLEVDRLLERIRRLERASGSDLALDALAAARLLRGKLVLWQAAEAEKV